MNKRLIIFQFQLTYQAISFNRTHLIWWNNNLFMFFHWLEESVCMGGVGGGWAVDVAHPPPPPPSPPPPNRCRRAWCRSKHTPIKTQISHTLAHTHVHIYNLSGSHGNTVFFWNFNTHIHLLPTVPLFLTVIPPCVSDLIGLDDTCHVRHHLVPFCTLLYPFGFKVPLTSVTLGILFIYLFYLYTQRIKKVNKKQKNRS